MTIVAMPGLGEAGRRYAFDLRARGYQVQGVDPYVELGDDRVDQFATVDEAVAESDLVIGLVGARAADEGVVVVAADRVGEVVAASQAREANVATARQRYLADVLSCDLQGFRTADEGMST
ncbi:MULTISPECIES: hypothetical protein [unclassified Micromonospora]